MKKRFVAIGAALLLLGAGCGGGGAATSSAPNADKEAVQSSVGGLSAAGKFADEAAVQSFVSVPIDDITAAGVSGYFEVASPQIDWSASTWSNNNNTVAIMSTDGITLGTWSKDTSGEWKATSAFWFE